MPPGNPPKTVHICIKPRDVISQPGAVAQYSGIGKRPAVKDETGKSDSYKNKEKNPDGGNNTFRQENRDYGCKWF